MKHTSKSVLVAYAILTICVSYFHLGVLYARATIGEIDIKTSELLHRWKKASASIKTVDCRFSSRNMIDKFELSDTSGHLVLKDSGYALLNIDQTVREQKTVNHLVWAGPDLHFIQPKDRICTTFPRSKVNSDKLPDILSLPFLFHLDVEYIKANYNVEIVYDDDKNSLVHFSSKDINSANSPLNIVIRLDKTSFLPNAMWLTNYDDKQRQMLTIDSIRTNLPVDDSDFSFREQDGWTVKRNRYSIEYLMGITR